MFNYKRRKTAGEENQDSKSENLDNMEYWKQCWNNQQICNGNLVLALMKANTKFSILVKQTLKWAKSFRDNNKL